MRNMLYFFEKQIRKLEEEASVERIVTSRKGSSVLVALSADFSVEKRCLLESKRKNSICVLAKTAALMLGDLLIRIYVFLVYW